MSMLSVVKKTVDVLAGPTATSLNPSGYRGNEMWLFNADGKGNDYLFSYTGHRSSLKAYQTCAPLTAIVNKKAQAYVNGKTWILNTQGQSKGKESTGEIAKKLRARLKQPNMLQSWKEFEAQQYIYMQIFGYCPTLVIKPNGFPNIDATALWNIPPSILTIEEVDDLFYNTKGNFIKRIVIDYNNQKSEIPKESVFFFKDFTVSFNSAYLPESRIRSLEMQINNINGSYEARNVLINYRGALGAISPEAKDVGGPVPLKEDDKEALQTDFLRYGIKNTQWKFIISSAAIKWSQIGIPTKELMLFEEIEDDIMRLCDSYNYPYPLISSNRTNSLGGNNIGESKTLLYQDAIIPEAESIYEQWNNLFELEKYGITMEKDFSHIQALQEDKVEQATARNILNDAKKKEFDAGLITLDQWLEALGEDPLPDGLGKVRASDIKNSNVPLAVTIGVGGVQGLISVITAQGMTDEARQATLEIVFGIAPDQAQRMSQGGGQTQSGQQQQQNNQSESQQ